MATVSHTLLLALTLLVLALLRQSSAYGDVLNRTICLCGTDNGFDPHAPKIPQPRSIARFPSKRDLLARNGQEQASYFLFEYYNIYLDHTFSMELTCRSSSNKLGKRDEPGVLDWKDCLNIMEHRRHKSCKRFSILDREITKRKHHEFCYHFHRSKMRRDTYRWDGQKRAVSKPWDLIYELKEAVHEICEPICRERFALPMFKEQRWYWKSRKDMVFAEDDMCEGCP